MPTTSRLFTSFALLVAISIPVSAQAPGDATPSPSTVVVPTPDDTTDTLNAPAARELTVERSCDRHQRVRPCREADGSDDFQCVATSPLAAVLHWLEKRDDDRIGEEVRVEVTRDVVHGADEVDREVRQQVRESRAPSVVASDTADVVVTHHPRTDRPLCRQPDLPIASTPAH